MAESSPFTIPKQAGCWHDKSSLLLYAVAGLSLLLSLLATMDASHGFSVDHSSQATCADKILLLMPIMARELWHGSLAPRTGKTQYINATERSENQMLN